MIEINVGCHCITWGPDGFMKAIAEISDLGYRGIEAFGTLVETWKGRVEEFQALMAEKRLRLASLYCGGAMTDPAASPKEIETAVRCARFIRANGGDVVVLGGGRVQPGQGRAAYHPHRQTLVETRDQLARLMDHSDPGLVFLAPDTGHLRIGGADPEEVFRTYIDRIIYVHYKDIQGSATAGHPPVVFAELGEGPINFRAVSKVLRSHDYSGWVMVELDRSARTPAQSAAISKKYMAEVLGFRFA
jgi:inosose dehydratase